MTLLLAFLRPGVVPTAAAQQVATIDAVRCDVADPVPGPKRASLGVWLAKVWRVFIIDKVPLGRRFKELVLGTKGFYPAPGLSVLLHHHLRCTVVFIFQIIPNHPEIRLGPPAGLHLAAPR